MFNVADLHRHIQIVRTLEKLEQTIEDLRQTNEEFDQEYARFLSLPR